MVVITRHMHGACTTVVDDTVMKCQIRLVCVCVHDIACVCVCNKELAGDTHCLASPVERVDEV